jgi:hypothetical protein
LPIQQTLQGATLSIFLHDLFLEELYPVHFAIVLPLFKASLIQENFASGMFTMNA